MRKLTTQGTRNGIVMNQRLKKKYGIPLTRYRELYYRCLQYPVWKVELENISEMQAVNIDGLPKGTQTGDPVYQLAVKRERLRDKISLIEKTAKDAGEDISDAILIAATTGATFDQLKQKGILFMERDAFYQRRRRFYWLLDSRME